MKNALRAARRRSRKTRSRKTISRRTKPRRPTLRFTPYAWAKLLCLRDLGDTEVGGFGISSGDDLLLVEDVRLVRETCSAVTVEFDDAAVADFFDQQVDQGRRPERFARIWLHTHPGNSATPSATDEDTFARCFGGADWSVIFILARGGACYARLRFGVGPGGEMRIPVEVDFTQPFQAADHAAWEEEYRRSFVPLDLGLDGFVQDDPCVEAWPPADEDGWFETLHDVPEDKPQNHLLEGSL